ncbi:uncharacterized protein K460DRAFT_410587 [Cucurbitaria berberidis CBS 394.84]|uniref:DUF7730 domain-containing protein n=1 Tax=Cucurbitaria berberidis CBS 394.84 TaxID=1168544 RepID=A0A9P4G970_9PLEO|nr:uncharacterized protein K460DRAFT_410587 [Cucurbitaria berberidis CBS 394.84]KAF1841197.1 hypothetical protein K460DRAFT_410587 [Cucurbitaria berberidis CBS 394.84]
MQSHSSAKPQKNSALLRAPAELRHEIYSYLVPDHIHACVQGDKLHLSTCVVGRIKEEDDSKGAMLPSSNMLDGYERQPKVPLHGDHDPVWAPRLRSTWGPHWICEENTLDQHSEGKLDLALLLVCRDMYLEVVDLLARTAVFHITDLETANFLHERPLLLCSMQLRLTQLSITLRPPIKFYQSLERPDDDTTMEPELASATQTWSRLGSIIRQFNRLSRLWIWLDHDDPCSWSLVNERATLQPLITQLSGSPNLKISIYLPRLHPKYEREDWHYTSETPTPFHLHRKLRQRWHGVEKGQGRFQVIHKVDFPFLIDIIGFDEMSMVEVEEEERKGWRKGTDMELVVEDLNHANIHENMHI